MFRKGERLNWRAAVTSSDGSVSLISNKGERESDGGREREGGREKGEGEKKVRLI